MIPTNQWLWRVGIHGMEPWLLREALNVLEAEGKVGYCQRRDQNNENDCTNGCAAVLHLPQAALIAGETCEEDGVKFLAAE